MKRVLFIWVSLTFFYLAFVFHEIGTPLLFFRPLPDGVAYAEESTQNLNVKIMPLGDSITFGTRDPSYGGYRHLLWTLLTNDGYKIYFVGSRKGGNASTPDSV